MSPTQVRAAEILLSKTLASLQSAEIKADVASYVARLPTPAANTEAWLASVKPPLLTATCLQHDTDKDDTSKT
jgi:hypothetical protein